MSNQKDDEKQHESNWGGARRGTGEPTKVIRVPVSLDPLIQMLIKEHNKSVKTDI